MRQVNNGEKGGDSQQWSIYNKALEQINANIKIVRSNYVCLIESQ